MGSVQAWRVSTTEDMTTSSRAVCNGLRWKSVDRNTQKQQIKGVSKTGVSGLSRGKGGEPGCETYRETRVKEPEEEGGGESESRRLEEPHLRGAGGPGATAAGLSRTVGLMTAERRWGPSPRGARPGHGPSWRVLVQRAEAVPGPGPALPQPQGLPPGLPVDPLGRGGTLARGRGGCSLGPLRKDFLGKWQKGWRGRV